ncbi:MAG: threonine/serine exporter family protein [Atopostipes sp.]|nr:threonine/serine exporter family protein [Atopostipes sp.]
MELLTSKILDVCTGIGRLMLENGAETYRVEDTIYRVAVNYGMQGVSVFSVPTALIVTVREPTGIEHTRLQRVTEQKSNLQIIADANNLSRKIAQTDIPPNEALDEIDQMNRKDSPYTIFQEFLIAGLTCGFFAILFQGNLYDLISSTITGSLGYLVFLYARKITNIRFFSELLSSFLIGWTAFLLTSVGIGHDVNIIIIASVMTLVPGKAITNGIRDLMASHLLSGVSVLADALLTASAIGIGIATVLSFI